MSSGNCAILYNEKPEKEFSVNQDETYVVPSFVHMPRDEEGVYSTVYFLRQSGC